MLDQHYETGCHSARAFFEFLIQNPTIHDSLFSYSSPTAIFRFSRTCRNSRRVANSYLRRAFDINKHLLRFFADPLGFRSLQARTGLVISGSNALQFFNRTVYSESDLDLYIDQRYAFEVGHWLGENGYIFQPRRSQVSSFKTSLATTIENGIEFGEDDGVYAGVGISGVFTFIHSSVDGLEKKVEVMTAPVNAVTSVLRFHSTCVMNLITYEKAYALYPRATFEERRSLGFQSFSAEIEAKRLKAKAKYAARGWNTIHTISADENSNKRSEFSEHRWIGDRFCWTIPFFMEGVQVPPPRTPLAMSLPRDNMINNSWVLSDRASFPEIHITPIQSQLLKYNYVATIRPLRQRIYSLLKNAQLQHAMANPDEDRQLYYDNEVSYICELYHMLDDASERFSDLSV